MPKEMWSLTSPTKHVLRVSAVRQSHTWEEDKHILKEFDLFFFIDACDVFSSWKITMDRLQVAGYLAVILSLSWNSDHPCFKS